MILLLWLHARFLLWLGDRQLVRMRRLDLRSAAAMARAEALISAARRAADRVERARAGKLPAPAADLLYGSRAIAAYLGVPKGVAVHLIRSRAIPWFTLSGVACARRSTLAAHFAALESAERP